MPIIFKLVGYLPDKKFYEIRDNFVGIFSLELLQKLFAFWNFTPDEISKVKFITDSEQIKSVEQKFDVTPNDTRIVFVFSPEIEVRNKLCEIFMREGHAVKTESEQIQDTVEKKVDPEISQPILIQEEPTPELTSELIDEMNLKTVKLFQDSDFKKLIGIYINRPELFNTFLRYIQHGNIVKELNIQINDKEERYTELLGKVRELDLQVSDDLIMIKLVKYSGHLNLVVREILYELQN